MGGFIGNEVDRDQRNVLNNITGLSGDLLGDDVDLITFTGDEGPIVDSRDDNSYHVVRSNPDVAESAVIDGFWVVHGGNSFLSEGIDTLGGGLLVHRSAPRILRCTFTQNIAVKDGAGAHVQGRTQSDPVGPEDPRFSNCRFFMNRMDVFGGGGGGLSTRVADPVIINSLFHDNYAVVGGGIFSEQVVTEVASLALVNCTIAFNHATTLIGRGGGIRNEANLDVANCILWGNTDAGPLDETEQLDSDGTPAVTYTDVQDANPNDASIPFGGAPNGNLDDDPLFSDVNGDDNLSGTADDNHRLLEDSPCVDAASDPAIEAWPDGFNLDQDPDTAEPTPDLDYRDRILIGDTSLNVDMGAYERVTDCVGDINGDSTIGFPDLLHVLSNWGPCPAPPLPCPGDFNGDGAIGFADLLQVLSNWGPCGSPFPVSPPQSVADCMQEYGLNAEDLAKCIEAMLLAGTP
jgi:hypothetical protein